MRHRQFPPLRSGRSRCGLVAVHAQRLKTPSSLSLPDLSDRDQGSSCLIAGLGVSALPGLHRTGADAQKLGEGLAREPEARALSADDAWAHPGMLQILFWRRG